MSTIETQLRSRVRSAWTILARRIERGAIRRVALRQRTSNLGPLGAASSLVFLMLGLDICQLGISKIGGEAWAFGVTNILRVAVALYAARSLCIPMGVQILHDRKANVRALTLVGILFSLLLLGDLIRPFASVAQATSVNCFPNRVSLFEELRVVFIAPVAEELLFTGFLLAVSRTRFDDLIATAFVAFVFSLMHLPGSFDLFLTRFVFMSASCVLFLKTSVLWPSVLMHMAGNTSLLLLGRSGELCEEMRSIHLPMFLNSLSLAFAMLMFLGWLAKKKF